jgi:glucose/arabinose dehydrogenase
MSLSKSLQLLIAFFCVSTSAWAETPIQLVKVVGGLNKPLAMVQPQGDSRMFIMEHEGLIKILEDGKITQTLLDLTSKVVPFNSDYSETGLLGLALHPNFQKNGKFYVAYSAPLGSDKTIAPPGFSHLNVVEEFVVGKNQKTPVDPNSGKRIHSLAWPHFNHNGHWIGFGPDQMLYISTGDGGYKAEWTDKKANYNSQKLDNYFGKILRIDVSQISKDKSYRVPADNPMVKVPDALPEIWAFGLRDPWRCSFDTKGSKQLICGDVQEDSFESIKIIEKGKNMGWPIVEGQMRCFSWENPQVHKDNCDKSAINPAVIEYPNCSAVPTGCKGISVAGGYVHRGSSAQLNGKYIFGDWSKRFDQNDGQIFVASPTKKGAWSMVNTRIQMSEPMANGKLPYVLAFAQDAKGNVYALTAVNSKRNMVFEDAIYLVKAD